MENYQVPFLRMTLGMEFERGYGSWYEPNMGQQEGGKWGLGEIGTGRRDRGRITPIEVLTKLQGPDSVKNPITVDSD